MATNNSMNAKAENLVIDPGTAGDSALQFDINGTSEFRIGVDDTDDSFRVSQGSALGTNDTFVMNDAGISRLELQPAFSTKLSSIVYNVTGDGTEYTVIWNSEIFDQNSDFNTSTGTFTAPITGRYFLTVNVYSNINDVYTSSVLKIKTSNRTYLNGINHPSAAPYSSTPHVCAVVDMDASDTAYVTYTVSAATKTYSIYNDWCYFSGYLVC